jgi:hypothetical protein
VNHELPTLRINRNRGRTKKTSLGYRTFCCSDGKRIFNERTGTQFNFVASAARFCRAFDEVRQFFRFRTTEATRIVDSCVPCSDTSAVLAFVTPQ